MYDLQWLAFRADLTRVITFMLGRELNFRTYPEIGINEGHHGLSHHQDNPAQLAKYARAEHLSDRALRRVPRQAAVRRPTATARCSIIRCSSTAPGSATRTCTPTTICRWRVIGGGAGAIKGGRHLVFRRETPMTNLLLSMLDKVGVRG